MQASNLHPHAKIIDRLGGPTAVAKALAVETRKKFCPDKDPEKVSNWRKRGVAGRCRWAVRNIAIRQGKARLIPAKF